MRFDESLPLALKIKRSELNSKGKLDWRGVKFQDLRGLGSQKKLQFLDISYSEIQSLHTMQPQPALREIVADYSSLKTFAGISNQPKLSRFSFTNTPLAQTKNSRLAAIIVMGTMASVINGKAVTAKERKIAASYPPVAKYLIESGWVLQYPPPNIFDFQFLADEFKLKISIEDLDPKQEPVEGLYTSLYDDTGEPSEFNDDFTPFNERLASILRPMGFAIQNGPEKNKDIARAVNMIADTILCVEEVANLPPERTGETI